MASSADVLPGGRWAVWSAHDSRPAAERARRARQARFPGYRPALREHRGRWEVVVRVPDPPEYHLSAMAEPAAPPSQDQSPPSRVGAAVVLGLLAAIGVGAVLYKPGVTAGRLQVPASACGSCGGGSH